MPTLSITKNYADGTTLTEAHLDTAFEGVETFLNTTKIDSDNIQTGGVLEAAIGTNAVTADKIISSAVTTAKIADSAVTAAKIATGVITQVKMGALGQQVSASCGSFGVTGGAAVDVTNLSVTITTTGRPVRLELISDGSGNAASVGLGNNGGLSAYGVLHILKDGVNVSSIALESVAGTTTNLRNTWPPSAVAHTEVTAAGTYTFKVQVDPTGASDYIQVKYCKLVAYEL